MSLALTHFAVGGTLTTILVLYVLPPTEYSRSVVLFGGIWGMIPDGHWVSPVYRVQLHALHGSDLANLFWMHKTLDVIDTGDSHIAGAAAVAAFVILTLAGDHWSYVSTEQAETVSSTALNSVRSVVALNRGLGIIAVLAGAVYLAAVIFASWARSLQGLYLAIGAILVLSGVLAATTTIETVAINHRWVPPFFRTAVQMLFSGAVLTAGLTLLATPLRYNIDALSVGYAGLGGILLLQAAIFAQATTTEDNSRPLQRIP